MPHVLVLSEDKANRDIANGFLLNPDLKHRNIQLLPHSKGWRDVLDYFLSELAPNLNKFTKRRVVLLIDFDDDFQDRSQFIFNRIDSGMKSRVFLLGTKSEPERLKVDLGLSFESIGKALANDCSDAVSIENSLWQNEHLQHNQSELARLMVDVKPFLFG
jgi:hypothetical protein